MILLKFRRNNFLFLFFCFFLFSYSSYSQGQSKNSKKDLENKKRRINDEIKEINTMLSETKAIKKSSIGALVTINMKISKRQELINTINAQINVIDREIQHNIARTTQLSHSLDKLKKEYARMIVFAQRNQDSYSVLMFIFAAENFSQAYARLKYIQQYSEFRKKQAIEIINTQTQLIASLKLLKEQRLEKKNLLGIEQEEKKSLSSEKSEKELMLTDLQQKEKELKTALEKKKQDAIELQAEIKRLIDAEIKRKAEEAAKAEQARLLAAKKAKEEKTRADKKRKEKNTAKAESTAVAKEEKVSATVPELSEEAIALSADFSNNRGKLPWPVAKGVICETYGEHEHPAIKGFMMFNNGVEICATKGSQARAVFEGEVTSIAVSPTGGKLVIIRHGEYLSVYCNLEDVLVKTGQKVSVKQAIGTVMHDEDDGKTSMNLQIWKGQKTMDPSGWLFNAR